MATTAKSVRSLLLLVLMAVVWEAPPLAAENHLLSAKAIVTEQQYCINDSHTFTVYFKLSFTFVNQTKMDVVLARKVKTPIVRVSTTIADAQAKRFLYNPAPYSVSAKPPEELNFGAAPDPQLFIILKPGVEYHTSLWTGVLANLTTKNRDIRSGIVAGDYFAQAVVNTWPFDTQPNPKILESWNKIGLLSNETIESAFFPVSFPVVKKAESCRTFKAPVE